MILGIEILSSVLFRYLKSLKISNIMFSDLPLKKKRIEIRKLSKYNLSRQYIRLFLKLLEYIGEI